jgi:hypothetical protein
MTIEEVVAMRLNDLIKDAESLRRGDEIGQANNDEQIQRCSGWLGSALNIVQILCLNESNAFRTRAEKIAACNSGWAINNDVGEFSALLINLERDINAGLLTSIADRARAETFDEFLEHGRHISRNRRNRKRELSVELFLKTQ